MPKEKSVIAKLRKNGKDFEILINPETAAQFRQGKSISLNDVLVIEEIYEDAKKGKRVSEHEMAKLFETDDVLEIAKIILKEGHVPLTEDMLKKEVEQKRKQIIDFIHKNTIDPNTKRPHPPARIETALSDAKVKIDPHKSALSQTQDVLAALRQYLPLKMETREIFVRVSAKYAHKTMILLKQHAKILIEKWETDGSLNATVELPAGAQEELETQLNNLSKGEVELKIIGVK